MRKLTGYIGAMIIVFALMGSILAGYALNINGTNTVMNEYEMVTDVSGLYSHTQEPSYIDYNPASNYIGYSNDVVTYDSDVGTTQYKDLQYGETTVIKTTGEILINGLSEGIPTGGIVYYITNQFYIEKTSGGQLGIVSVVGTTYGITSDITISTSGTNTTVATTGFNVTFQSVYHNICYWVIDDTYDYYRIDGRLGGNYNNYDAYIKTDNDILTLSRVSPGLVGAGDELIITQGGGYGLIGNNAVFGLLPNNWIDENRAPVTGGYEIQVNYETRNDYWGDVTNPGYKNMGGIWIFYPRSISTGGGLGINYTESNRVNNYLINTDPANTITTETTIDLMSISAANQYPVFDGYWRNTLYMVNRLSSDYPYPHYSYTAPYWIYQNTDANSYNGADMLINYKLSDILSTYSTPQGATSLKITTDSNGVISGGNGISFDANICGFVTINPGNIGYTINNLVGEKDYLIYDITNNTCTIYDYNGVVQSTNTPDNIGVVFCKNTGANYSAVLYSPDISTINTSFVEMSNRPAPFIKITSYQYNPAYNHYMDITKGLFIENTNITNTVWDNEYSNGRIQILFRSSETMGTYHNGLIVGDNNISIDYTTNRYYITLNGGDPVDIGTWRNIVLDIDLINGKLSAIPVRTFNSFTNVIMDNTNIFIGDLVNAAPVNTIEWTPTVNSLAFNVYSTSVFMNTYGVVMVDPTLNITNYFTNLDNFYQLRLSNFSMYGQSMTVNGVTGTVTGDKITFNGETVQLKDMAITYADGNVTISDSYGNIDLGAIVDNTVSMTGAWYFISVLYSGYTTQKVIYDWDWGQFILDDKAFGVIYIGLCIIGLIVARHFCTLTITDYILFVVSIAIALTVPVIA